MIYSLLAYWRELLRDGILLFKLYTPLIWGLSKRERSRNRAEALYELETGFREQGWSSEESVYDAEHNLYRFPDG